MGQRWSLPNLREELENGSETITAKIEDGDDVTLRHDFSEHEREILLAGGLLSYLRDQESGNGAEAESGGGGRAAQSDAGERAESEDGSGNGGGVIRESGQGVGGHHE